MKIVADQAIPFLAGIPEPYAEVRYLDGRSFTPEAVRDADALIIRTRTRCDAALLEGSAVRMIATATIGFDHIDLNYCRSRGIEVVTAAGCNARGVLQWVAAALVSTSRRQRWQPHERTLGIVGVGHVGSLVREYAGAWGFRVLCCDPPRAAAGEEGFVTLDELLAGADIVTLHVPLDASTRHMADSRFFAAMRPGALLLNSSRGDVVDSQALLAGGHPCMLDVWEGEPHPDPALLARAWIATPHIAGYSLQGKANATAMVVRAVAARFGWPLTEWYPDIAPTPVRTIGWEELCATIGRHFDIEAESAALKAHPDHFESIRNTYPYRPDFL